MSDKLWDFIVLIFWFFIGFSVLMTDVTKISYACIWVCFLVELGFKLIKDCYDDNDKGFPI